MKEQKGTRINVWFISDTHFSHPSILYFHPERREAAGITLEELQADKHAAVEKHDEWLINLWNKIFVGYKDMTAFTKLVEEC